MKYIIDFLKKKAKSIEKKVLVAGYPRSGNSWFNYMLANLLGAKWIDIHKPEVRNSDPEIRRRTGWGDKPLSHNSPYAYVIKSHQRRDRVKDIEQYDKIIYLVRDPRDVLVSYFYFRNLHEPKLQNQEIIDIYNKQLVTEKFSELLSEVTQEWKKHYLTWANHEKYILKYEDLLSDTKGELEKVCNYLGYKPPADILTDVVNFYEFEKMSSGRKHGEEDNDKFVRKGIVGDYKNYLSGIQLDEFNTICGPEMRALGY